MARVLNESEEALWPQTRPDLAAGAKEKIDIVGYAYPFVFELLPDAAEIIAQKCRNGAQVRLAFADPDSAHVAERDALEQMNGTLAGRIQNALSMLGELDSVSGCQVGLHSVHLYNSVFRFDDQMIVTPYLIRARGYQHTAFHLRRLSSHGIFSSFADQVEQLWGSVAPYQQGVTHGKTA